MKKSLKICLMLLVLCVLLIGCQRVRLVTDAKEPNKPVETSIVVDPNIVDAIAKAGELTTNIGITFGQAKLIGLGALISAVAALLVSRQKNPESN